MEIDELGKKLELWVRRKKTGLKLICSRCGQHVSAARISGGADTSRNGFVIHRKSRLIGFLPDAIALTGVTTAGKMESQLEKGELR